MVQSSEWQRRRREPHARHTNITYEKGTHADAAYVAIQIAEHTRSDHAPELMTHGIRLGASNRICALADGASVST